MEGGSETAFYMFHEPERSPQKKIASSEISTLNIFIAFYSRVFTFECVTNTQIRNISFKAIVLAAILDILINRAKADKLFCFVLISLYFYACFIYFFKLLQNLMKTIAKSLNLNIRTLITPFNQ